MDQKKTRYPFRILRLFCNPEYLEEIEGDLLEKYKDGINYWHLTIEIIKLLRPRLMQNFEGSYRLNQYGLFRNKLRTSIRFLKRDRIFTLINISGLSVGIAISILILIYINHELSYDTYNTEYQNTYRVIHYYGPEGKAPDYTSLPTNEFQVYGNAPIGPAIKQYFPEIEKVFQFSADALLLLSNNSITNSETDIIFADPTAFEIFDWKILAGNLKNALVRPYTIVLTKELAEKYFPDEDPIGKCLLINNTFDFEVTGVVEVPSNSHFSFNGLISMSSFRDSSPNIFNQWDYIDFYTYFTVQPGTNIEKFQQNVPEFLEANFPDNLEYFNYTIAFEPLSDAYLHSDAGRQPGSVGSIENIYILTCIAIFILLMACFNFINLSIARSVERAKEVIIRKVIGSQRQSFVYQFLIEAFLLVIVASAIAVILVVFGYSWLEVISGKNLSIEWLFNAKNAFVATVALLLTGVIAGIFPGFVFSAFKPITVFNGSFKSSNQGMWLRKSLVVFQFVISISLLAGSTVVSSQLDFLHGNYVGFNASQVLVIDFGFDSEVQKKRELLKQKFLNHKDVILVSAARGIPGDYFPLAGTGIADPESDKITFENPAIYEVDEDYIPTYEIKVVAGRNFSNDSPLDSVNALILNESAVAIYDYSNPEDIIGKSFEQWGRTGKVIGVVEDFNYVSLHKKVEPLSIRFGPEANLSVFSLKIQSQNYFKTLSELESIWKEEVPHRPFDTRFADRNFASQYESDEQFEMMFTVFSSTAIFVMCLGLFGLTIHINTQRNKEVAIRKVLGASASQIISILSKDVIILYLVALMISIPVYYYGMNSWLNGFAYHISLSFEFLAVASIIILLLTSITISFKTISSSHSNPVESLKDE